MKSFEMFVKTDCSYCKKAIELLINKKIPFVITVVDKNPEYLEDKKIEFNHPTVPIIFEVDNGVKNMIGGFSELEDLLDPQESQNNE